jgi:hypothetical protein
MISLRESLLDKTANKTSTIKRLTSGIIKELENTPTEWKIDYDTRDCGRSLYWHLPETLQFIKSSNDYNGVVICRNVQGLEFYVDERRPEILIHHRPMRGGFRLHLLGWNFIVKGSVEDRKKAVMELIHKLKDFETMEKLFAQAAEYEENDLKPDQRKDILKDL